MNEHDRNGRNHLYDDGTVIHACEGSMVHPGIYLVWTKCQKDVPANQSFLSCVLAANCPDCHVGG